MGRKNDETVTSIWGKLQGAAAVASLMGMMVPCVWGGVAGRTQSSAAATEQTQKPASKGKTGTAGKSTPGKSTAGKSTAGGSKSTGSSKTTKGKSATAGKTRASTASRRPTAQTIYLTSAFKASEQLRPMAQ